MNDVTRRESSRHQKGIDKNNKISLERLMQDVIYVIIPLHFVGPRGPRYLVRLLRTLAVA